MLSPVAAIARRELKSYFTTPVAYVFIAAFLGLSGFFTFQISMFYEAGQADLSEFFGWHPWLYLFLVPAVAMRLWAEEKKSGTIELLLTLPVTPLEAVAGKFLAGWALLAAALALTLPTVLTAFVLGNPDPGQVVSGYIGSFFTAGAMLAIGCALSAATSSQVIAFVGTALTCLVFMLSNLPAVQDFLGESGAGLGAALSSLSLLGHYEGARRGVVEPAAIIFYLSMIVAWLFATTLILKNTRSG